MCSVPQLAAQTPQKIQSITVDADQAVRLQFSGAPATKFRRFHSIYPVEASPDLQKWERIALLSRTNGSTAPLSLESPRTGHAKYFYRTPSTNLVTPFPSLTGPYAVGTKLLVMHNPDRTNRVYQTNFPFLVTMFYPATPTSGALPSRYAAPQVASSINSMWAIAAVTIDPAFFAQSQSNAVIARSAGPFPVVTYSPGYTMHRFDNTHLCEELASHGFVVAAMDHRDSYVTLLPDGTTFGDLSHNVGVTSMDFDLRAKDLQFLLSEIERLNLSDPEWAGLLDTNRIGAFGFSAGGNTSSTLGRTDSRIKAFANMDGNLSTLWETDPATKPFRF
ncbi:MAG TPA: hypothetical protein VEH27_10500 [Methylomirabilota bacterium]|nr:hypothetical protein [Methylomirabilota bacterium]